jgi:hypothetical protein
MKSLYQTIGRHKTEFLALLLLLILAAGFLLLKNGQRTTGLKIFNQPDQEQINELKADPANLVLDGQSRDISQDAIYKNIYLLNGSELYIKKLPSATSWPSLTVSETVYIDKNSKIISRNEDPADADFIRVGAASNDYGGDGGTLAGQGGSGNCLKKPGNLPDLKNGHIYSGAAGAPAAKISGSKGGQGGGTIIIKSSQIILGGAIQAIGQPGINSGGGGAGGYVSIDADKLVIEGKIDLEGGNGGDGQIHGGGGGAGGLLILHLKEIFNGRLENFINLEGGQGGIALDIYTGCQGEKGADGQIIK